MTIERTRDGGYFIADWVTNKMDREVRVRQLYLGYSKKEAVARFRELRKEAKNSYAF